MKQVADAIAAYFNAPNTFNTAIGGRMYFEQAPMNASYPYAVFFLITNIVDYTFKEESQDLTVQFSIFDAGDGLKSPATLYDAQNKLWALFDFAPLSVTGYSTTIMKRQGTRNGRDPELNSMFSHTDYQVRIQKQ